MTEYLLQAISELSTSERIYAPQLYSYLTYRDGYSLLTIEEIEEWLYRFECLE